MTVIRPNSVAGINSITVQSGNSLAVHKANGELIRTITSSSGISTFSTISVGTAATDNSAGKSINIGLGASISQHTDNTLSLGTGGDERARIDSSGDMGLGTSTIENFGGGHVTLEVAGSTTSQGGVFKTATSDSAGTGSSGTEMIMFTDNTKGAINVVSSDPLTFSTANTERLRITSGGSVGIGTDTINAPLTVVQNDNSGHIASFRQKNSGNSAQILIESPTDNNIRPVSIDLAQAGTIKWSLGQAYAALSDRAFQIATSALSANDTNSKLTITTGGNVGVSSRSPNSLLTVGPKPNSARSSHPTVLISPASGNASLLLRGNSPTIDFDSTSGGNAQVCIDNADLTINDGTIDDPSLNNGELVRITSSGNVGINPDASGPDKLLHVSDSNNGGAVIPFRLTNVNGTSGTEVRMEFECGVDEIAYIGAKNEGSDIGPLIFATATSQAAYPTEKARINPGGSLTVGTTSDDGGGSSNTDDGCVLRKDGLIAARVTTSTNNVAFTAKTTDTGGCNGLRCMSAQTEVGGVSFNSGGTNFNQSSDYRRKENIVDLTDSITRLKTLLPKRFNFKTEPSVTRDGFLAHEVTAVPEAVTGTKDAVATENDVITNRAANVGDPIYQQLDQSKLVPLLTAALQEAITKIETLETKVAALEGG